MFRRLPFALLVLLAVAGCTGGSGRLGELCGGNDDCDGTLQCLNSRCVPHCERAPECGDGYSCDERGYCRPATGSDGDRCRSEVDCAAGLSCQISDTLDENNQLRATCNAQTAGRPSGARCDDVNDCRNGTCALGHCVDLCAHPRDCAAGNSCVTIPHVPLPTATYSGCLPSLGAMTWSIPMSSPTGEALIPVPVVARSVELVMSVNDPGQKVGASAVLLQNEGSRPYNLPCSMDLNNPCGPVTAADEYYTASIRHLPGFGQSVLLIPSGTQGPLGTAGPLGPSVLRVDVSSFLSNNSPGSAIPHVTAVVQLSAGKLLDLHFFFLDLSDHPCAVLPGGAKLDARSAPDASVFRDIYLGELRLVFGPQLPLGTLTYEDITEQPRLDTLDVADAGDLLSLGKYANGINVFFVRSLSPMGLQAFGPNPGPAGIAGTRQSGIVIGLDTLCYRDWASLARLTAHEIARYMGLYHNVELEIAGYKWRDLIDDNNSDDPSVNRNNLMFFSELGGSELSGGQREMLSRSAVLR